MLNLFIILTVSIILINGWTDAPNAIATCVSSRSLSPRPALWLAAICNFLGCITMWIIAPSVAMTVFGIVDLSKAPEKMLPALCAGMCAVVIWSAVACRLGIPTSESHGILAGITGSAYAASLSSSVINLHEWSIIAIGLFVSTFPAFIAAKLLYSTMCRILSHLPRRIVIKHFIRAQRCSAASSAFLHGAQDSQKFLGVFMLGIHTADRGELSLPFFAVLICALTMAVGTLLGGKKIIKKVGVDMVSIDAAGGTASDMASSAVLTLCSFFGIPVSTTHTKSCALMGVGSCNGHSVNKSIMREITIAWILTFPICAALGFIFFFIFPS